MNEKEQAEIILRVPGDRAYALVIRTALGGVAILKDLDVDTMDDLRTAVDEACECLLHQGRAVSALNVTVHDENSMLTVSLESTFAGDKVGGDCSENTVISQAVLETLIPHVALSLTPCGCVRRIDLTLPKAAV